MWPPEPLMTSCARYPAIITFRTSQKTPGEKGEYTDRPREHNRLLAAVLWNPRAADGIFVGAAGPTLKIGEARQCFGQNELAPERRMSSEVITKTDLARRDSHQLTRSDPMLLQPSMDQVLSLARSPHPCTAPG